MTLNPNTKISSLNWAVAELDKQKNELNTKLGIAQKREETANLLKEVIAQKDAMEKGFLL